MSMHVVGVQWGALTVCLDWPLLGPMQAVKRSPQVLVLAGSVYMKAPAYRLMTFWRSSSSHSLHGL